MVVSMVERFVGMPCARVVPRARYLCLSSRSCNRTAEEDLAAEELVRAHLDDF